MSSLHLGNRGNFVLAWGASNVIPPSTGPTPAGYTLPANMRLWISDGSELVSQETYLSTHHGIEVGIGRRLCDEAGKSLDLAMYRVNGSLASAWTSTYGPELRDEVLDLDIGYPCGSFVIQGGAEGASETEAAALAWADNARAATAVLKSAFGAAHWLIFVGEGTVDYENFEWIETVKSQQSLFVARTPCSGIVYVNGEPLVTDVSGTAHFTSATAILAGYRAADLALQVGLIL